MTLSRSAPNLLLLSPLLLWLLLPPQLPTAETTRSVARAAPQPSFSEPQELLPFQPYRHNKWMRDRHILSQLRPQLCRPRPTMVAIAPRNASAGERFSPERVLVERCAGACGSVLPRACAPTKTEKVNLPVLLLPPGRNATVGQVTVERHLACTCACATQRQHCSDRQEYLEKECRCACRSSQSLLVEARACGAKPRFAWNSGKCRCGCDPRAAAATCGPQHVWVPQVCQCRRFLPQDTEDNEDQNNMNNNLTSP